MDRLRIKDSPMWGGGQVEGRLCFLGLLNLIQSSVEEESSPENS